MEQVREAILLRLPRDLKLRIEATAKNHLRSCTREIELAVLRHCDALADREQ
jgi:hypothetical protein